MKKKSEKFVKYPLTFLNIGDSVGLTGMQGQPVKDTGNDN